MIFKNSHYFKAILIILIMFSADTVFAIKFTKAEKESLAMGKTVRKPLKSSGYKGFYGGSGFTIIDAPVDVVWRALQDWGSYHRIFAATSSVKEVERRGSKSLIKMNMGHKFISLEYYMQINRDFDKKIMSFSLVTNRPHDIESSKGYWRLFPQKNGKTLVAYVVSAQVPMGIINLLKPKWKEMIERNLVGAPNDLRKWIASSNGQKYFTMTARN
jgi:hypothetical protein